MMKGERGLTLVELIMAIAITGLTFGVLGAVWHHVVTIPEYGNDRVTALSELQNVAHRVNLDGQMAQSATGGSELVLTLPDDSSITYTLVGTDLIRTTGTSSRTLAQNISSVNFSVSTQDRYITMNIISSPSGRWEVSENRTYLTCLRPSEAP
jgi:prepilin-type N-terminal cleavage/methylation domain-containing protein